MTQKIIRNGFTIVELLIVILVIGILATLVLVSVGSIAQQARDVKITHDLAQLRNSIYLAESNQSGVALKDITGNIYTANSCTLKPDGTDFSKVPKTDACWVDYNAALAKIMESSGTTGLKDLTDPYGRPYYIDENELEYTANPCIRDYISVYRQPFLSGAYSYPKYNVILKYNTLTCQ